MAEKTFDDPAQQTSKSRSGQSEFDLRDLDLEKTGFQKGTTKSYAPLPAEPNAVQYAINDAPATEDTLGFTPCIWKKSSRCPYPCRFPPKRRLNSTPGPS